MSDDERVGFGKPPKKNQFQPGQSGNPNGRPRLSKNFSTIIAEEASQEIPIHENGKRKHVSKREAIGKQLVNKAVSGDPKFVQIFLTQQQLSEASNLKLNQGYEIEPADEIVMASIIKRCREFGDK